MNRLINLIVNKKINHNINKFAIAKFVHDYKEQFISEDLDFNCLHNLHIILWSRIVQYYENYIFGPIKINEVKPKILQQLMKNIKRQTSSLHCCDRFEFINNLESLFRTLKQYNFNCFACYYDCNDCDYCPVVKWRKNKICYEYSQLCHLTKNKKDFNLHKQDIINLSKEIHNLEWVVINEQNKTK